MKITIDVDKLIDDDRTLNDVIDQISKAIEGEKKKREADSRINATKVELAHAWTEYALALVGLDPEDTNDDQYREVYAEFFEDISSETIKGYAKNKLREI